MKAITIPFSANVRWWITEKKLLDLFVCNKIVEGISIFWFLLPSSVERPRPVDERLWGWVWVSWRAAGCGGRAIVLPLPSLTCVNQGVSAPRTAWLPQQPVRTLFQGPPVAESWYFKTSLTGCLGSRGAERFLNLHLPFLWTKGVGAENPNCATDHEPSISNIPRCWKWCQIMSQELHSHFLFLKTQYTDEKLRQRADRWITWRLVRDEARFEPGLSSLVAFIPKCTSDSPRGF